MVEVAVPDGEQVLMIEVAVDGEVLTIADGRRASERICELARELIARVREEFEHGSRT
jgi:hypothetical protein